MWGYTPKQADGFVRLARRRQKREFSLSVLAARGKGDDVKNTIDGWERDR